jgi:hypothetical protein
VYIDTRQVAATHLHRFPLTQIPIGQRHFEARAEKSGNKLHASVLVQIAPGLQPATTKLELA